MNIRLRYIYCTINTINHKTYIGQRTCYPDNSKHISRQKPETDRYIGSGFLLKKALKKYGKNNFTKIIIFQSYCTKKEIDEVEKYYIRLAKMAGKAEYNITDGGQGGDFELGDIISIRVKETWNDKREYRIQKMREGQIKLKNDKERYDERRIKISINRKGKGCGHRNLSEETIAKLRQRSIGKSYRKGMRQSNESNEKNRKAHIGRHFYNNGIIMVLTYSCPDGFKPGMLKVV